ncbi:MAG: alkaline phosphatase family protein [Verrucomicrobia bacterium]|nr:alkaline phosphatase family protein [Verrucomicrobiota bacterium]
MSALARKVLLIGWDAADWGMIHPLLDAGRMPHLRALLEGGVMGNLLSLQPMLSPILWTSIATGKRAWQHGVLGFAEPQPDGSGLRAVQSTARRCKALWNILHESGRRVHTAGWYASHPVERLDGVAISNQFAVAPGRTPNDPWPLSTEAVHPPGWRDRLAELRIHPGEIPLHFLQQFIPRVHELNRMHADVAGLLQSLRKRLAECLTLHAAFTDVLEHEPWDFATVYYESIDHIGHDFMAFHPPKLDRLTPEAFEFFRHVMDETYCYHDLLLGRLLELAGPEAHVVLVSDHGFQHDHRRPGPEADPAEWHRNFGVFAARGPGLHADTVLHGATLLDVAPTILTLFGLPVGEDMEGKVLLNAFVQPPAVERIPSWERVGETPAAKPASAPLTADDLAASQAVLQQLVELGYLPAPGEDAARDIALAVAEQRFNLAAVQLDAGRPAEAVPIAQALMREFPDQPRFVVLLGQAAVADGQREVLDEALVRLTELRPEHRQIPLFRGFAALLADDPAAAAQAFAEAAQREPNDPWLHGVIGRVRLRLRDWPGARVAFERSLRLSADNPEAHYGLSVALPRLGEVEKGLAHALEAVAQMHDFPRAHFQLGAILVRLGWYERAVEAFELVLVMRPGFALALRYLARLYPRVGRPVEAARIRQALEHLPAAASPGRPLQVF